MSGHPALPEPDGLRIGLADNKDTLVDSVGDLMGK